MRDKLVREAKAAVKPSSGLHVSVKPTKNQRRLQWVDVGSTTSSMVEEIFRQHQPLTWDYLTAIATAEPRKRNGVLQERKIRPVNRVATHVMSVLNFSRNQEAQLLPTLEAMYQFATLASYDTFAYSSRIARTTAYSTG